MMQEFFTWTMLATYAGALAAATLFTQLLKGLKAFEKVPARAISYAVALLVLVAANYFLGELTLESGALCIINAAVVALASNGAFEALPLKTKEEKVAKKAE